MLEEAGRLSPRGGLRPATYRTLFGLIAATGLRISEALHLGCSDVDLSGQTLTVRQTKFRKSRLLYLHPSTVKALEEYVRVRDWAVGRTLPFFVSAASSQLPLRTVHEVFVACVRVLE